MYTYDTYTILHELHTITIYESKHVQNTNKHLHEQRVNLELLVADYDRIGSSDPIGKVLLGYNRKGLELKHWKEMIENPRRPIVHWHVLKVKIILSAARNLE